jgi:hypothetical protein
VTEVVEDAVEEAEPVADAATEEPVFDETITAEIVSTEEEPTTDITIAGEVIAAEGEISEEVVAAEEPATTEPTITEVTPEVVESEPVTDAAATTEVVIEEEITKTEPITPEAEVAAVEVDQTQETIVEETTEGDAAAGLTIAATVAAESGDSASQTVTGGTDDEPLTKKIVDEDGDILIITVGDIEYELGTEGEQTVSQEETEVAATEGSEIVYDSETGYVTYTDPETGYVYTYYVGVGLDLSGEFLFDEETG